MGRTKGSAPARRRTSLLAVLAALISAIAVVGIGVAPAYAAPGIAVTKSAGATVLVGGTVSFTLTATNPTSNPDAANEFNVSFRDELAPGLTYQAGSTTPADVGDPQISTAGDGHQILVWPDVADMRPGASVQVSFRASVDPADHPVGSSFTNAGTGYANTDPSEVPTFDGAGNPTGGFTELGASNTTTTQVSAIDITKSSTDTPEGELLRGVHQHPSTYTLTVTNNGQAATDNALLVDYLPAGLEFLGCGDVDNTPGSAVEYPGSGRLDQIPDVAGCPAPVSVDTVLDPSAIGATGVFTRVAWELGDLTPGQVVQVSYAAGIPQRSNTMDFPGGRPTATSLGQGANLDNNSGASTREGLTELSLTNHGLVVGSYEGDVEDESDADVIATTTHTVTAEDVSLQKSVSPGAFTTGEVATYTLVVRTSEYDNASDIVLSDHLPDGLCPLSSTTNYQADGDPACDPGPGFDPVGADYAQVVPNADGSFDITFTDLVVGHDETATVTYQARMRPDYEGGNPTAAGDSFTNTAELDAVTRPRGIVQPEGGGQDVTDSSSATLTSQTPTVTKLIQPQTGVTPSTCSADAGDYAGSPQPLDGSVTFTEGSRVCFLVRATFPGTVDTKNVTVSDVIPDGMEFEDGSEALFTGPDHLTRAEAAFSTANGVPTWTLGTNGTGGRFVAPGAIFEARFSAIVVDPAAGPAPDQRVNRVKLAAENTDGSVGSRRDEVTFLVPAPPPVTIDKTADVADGATVEADQAVQYSLAIGNGGTSANGNDQDIIGPDVRDLLPQGIDCADITAISSPGTCADPGGGQPSVLRWNLPDTVTIAPGATLAPPLTYTMTIPTDASVAISYTNTAGVASYASESNLEDLVQHHPADNIDPTTDPDDIDAPAADDDFTVVTQDIGLTKSNVTAIDAAGNTGTPDPSDAEQAVIGEEVTYTVTGTVPAHSTVNAATITDPLPAGLAFLSSSVASSLDGGPASPGVPAGFDFDAATGTLDFPASYTNGDDDDLFVITILARVTDDPVNTHGAVRTNTSTFSATGTSRQASSNVTVVEPAPALTKSDDDANGVVTAEQPVVFTLTAGNAAGRPTLHDAFVVDCVPEGMTVTDPGTATVGGTDGCPAGSTRLVWSVGDLDPAETVALSYTAQVDLGAVALATYTNTATLAGSSLDDDKAAATDPDNPLERGYTASASDTVQVAPAEVTKAVDQPTGTIGERRTYTATITVPQNVDFFDALVVDQLPTGLDATTLRLEGPATCVRADSVPCTVSADPLAPAPGPGGSTLVGYGFGDVTSVPSARVLTIVYSVVVADIAANARGTVVTNGIQGGWNTTTNGPDPVSAAEAAGLESHSNTATASITVTEPDLTVDKTVSDPTPEPGGTFTYTVVVSNTSGSNVSDAFDTTVVDTVPDGVVVDGSTISNGGVLAGQTAVGGGTITWTLAGPIAVGTPVRLSYDAELATPTPDAALTNTADITEYFSLDDDVAANAGDRVYDGPEDTATVSPALPHVSIDKTVQGGDLAYIGESKPWQITVTSDGDTTARDVSVTDVLPPNWSYDAGSAVVRVTTPPATDSPIEPGVTGAPSQTITWPDLVDLPVGESVIIDFTATPGAAVVGIPGVGHSIDQTNTASVTAEDGTGANGPAGGGSYASGPDTAVAHIDAADVVLDKSHTGTPVAGEPFSWSVVVSNQGPDTAVGPFEVTDTFPPGLVGAGASGPGWDCTTGTTTLTCVRANPADVLAPGAAFPAITVTGAIPAGGTAGTPVVNQATVDQGRTYDPNLANNSDSDPAVLTTSADLEIVKTLTGDLLAGTNATYDLQVTNHGPSVHRGLITVTDVLPSGTTFVAQTGAGWTFAQTGQTLTWTRTDTQPVGPLPLITVTVLVDDAVTGPVQNPADVTGTTPDPDPDNNHSVDIHTPDTAADLILEKAHDVTDPDGFDAGNIGTYRFSVFNAGPSAAQETVTITDTLPTELTYVGFSSLTGSWDCFADDQDVTCELAGDLAAGALVEVEIRVLVDPGATGDPIVNTAHVGSPTTDPNPDNNDDEDNTEINIVSDLEVHKSHAGNATSGEDFNYSITVTNNGTSDSSGPIRVADVLPQGMSYVSGTGTSWSCSAPSGDRPRTVPCVFSAPLGAGATTSVLTLVAHVAPDAGPATLVNRAVVDGPPDEIDDDLTNNVTADPTDVDDDVEVSVAKVVAGPNPVDAGGRTSFTLTAHNDGPSDADDVEITDALPPGMTLVSISGTGWTCTTAPAPSCTMPTLAAGATSAPITLEVDIGSAVPNGAILANVATVQTSSAGDTPAGNSSTAQVTVVTAADLELHKRHPASTQVVAGEQTRYAIDVTNNGPSDARSPLQVVDDLPADMTYLSSDGGWTCAVATVGGHQQVTCTLAQVLGSGQDAPVLGITVLVSASADPGLATNTAVVSSPTEDRDPDNNDDSIDVTVVRSADLAITKTHDGEATVGAPLTYHLAVTNLGPSDAPGVVVRDALPLGVGYVSATGTGWACSAAGALVTCTRADVLPAGADAPVITVVVDVLPGAYPAITNQADVAADPPDPDLDNNTASDRVTVPPQVNLTLTKEHTGQLDVGQQADYLLVAANEGPTPDPGRTQIVDQLPVGLTYVSSAGAGWACVAPGRTVTCGHDGLAVGEKAPLRITVDVHPEAYPEVTNLAAVSTPSAETKAVDNVAADRAQVLPLVQLDLLKEVVSVTPSTVRYDITTTNLGPNVTVEPVVMVDDLPTGLHYVDAKGPGWDCASVSDTVTCTHPASLAVDESSPVRLVAKVAKNAPDTIDNVAQVSGGGAQHPGIDGVTVDPPESGAAGSGGGGSGSGGTGAGAGSGPDGVVGPGALPGTGGPPLLLPLLGLLMLAGGVALVLAGRRRRRP